MKLVINTGRTVAVVARELGVKEQTLGRWVNLFKARHEAADGPLSESERAELARLRKENSDLKMDRAFLKKSLPLLRPGSIGYEPEAFALMHAEKSNFTIRRMARLLDDRGYVALEDVQIGAADGRRLDADDDVGRVLDRRVRNVALHR